MISSAIASSTLTFHLPKMDRQVHERGDGEPAGGFAGAAHPVGDDHPVPELIEALRHFAVREARHERFLVTSPGAGSDSGPR